MNTTRKRMERTTFPSEKKKGNSGSDQRNPRPTLEVGNDFTVHIEEMSKDREGIAHIDGYMVFIDNTNLGEDVKVKITKVQKTTAKAIRIS